MRSAPTVRAGALLIAAGLVLLPACGGGEDSSESGSGGTTEVVTTRTLGLTYLDQNQLDKAEEQFRKLVDLVPGEALGHANLGLVLLRTGRLDSAETQLERARELDPDHPRVNLILARLLQETDRSGRARTILQQSLEANPEHVQTLNALAEMAEGEGAEARRQRRSYLRRIVEARPGNRAARLDLAETQFRLGATDSAAAQLEQLRQLEPGLPEGAREDHELALEAARSGDAESALGALVELRGHLEVTPPYQRERTELQGPVGNLEGYPVLTFSRDLQREINGGGTVAEALTFADASGAAGFRGDATAEAGSDTRFSVALALAGADVDGDGDVDLAAPTGGERPDRVGLWKNDLGRFSDVSDSLGLGDVDGARAAEYADYDNDGRLDLYVVRDGPNRLYRQREDGSFREVAGDLGVDDAGDGRAAVFADFDHDGDLDLYVVNEGRDRYYRNGLDGSFTDRTAEAGFGADTDGAGRDASIGDFNGDAVIDLVVADTGGVRLFLNQRRGRFEPAGEEAGLSDVGASTLAVGDFDNDGSEDLFVGLAGGGGRLLDNDGDAGFRRRDLDPAGSPLPTSELRDVAVLDVDNDGRLDLAAVTPADDATRGIVLLHNRGEGGFEDISSKLPPEPDGALEAATLDYNDDGDQDLVLLGTDGRKYLFRNDGGNANRYLNMRLVGLGIGSGKVNQFGIGARVEIRAGDTRRALTVRGPRVHVGLGDERRPDVVRIRWTNGVPQNLYLARGDQEAVQDQTLKGSCAFLYAWNGERTEFVTDVIWRSALGMPVGIMGEGARSYAPPDASREYVRLPGEKLAPRDGAYRLKVTEELWETAYVDELRLVTVDHPDSAEIFVDERFRPSSHPPNDRIYAVSRRLPPASARDGEGRDVRRELLRNDDDHVTTFAMGRYQGLAEMHELVLTPGDLPEGERVFLFLSGWVYPTDASINVALAQSDSARTVPPELQVRDEEGQWRTAIENISFPAGKEKTVVVELTDRFLSTDRSVRIRTNLQVYWDRAFFATGDLRAPMRRRSLTPDSAQIRFRGFSRMYRKGGRHGPHWFEYDSVSTRSPWLPIRGPFTRYGGVTELLQEADDRYVVAGPGDEIDVRFDAGAAPDVPSGWRRDFLLYSDGWIKDADLNTATGHRVRPLPFHAMPRYPYGGGIDFPADSAHRAFLRTLSRSRPHPPGGEER